MGEAHATVWLSASLKGLCFALNLTRPIKRFQEVRQLGEAVEYGKMRGGVQHGGGVCACGEGDGGGFGVGGHFQVVGRIADNQSFLRRQPQFVA